MNSYQDIYSYQTGLNVLHTYLKLDQLDYNDFKGFYNQTAMLQIPNDFLFCTKDKHFYKIVKKYNLYEWYLKNNIDLYLDEILEFIIVLKSKLISNYYLEYF